MLSALLNKVVAQSVINYQALSTAQFRRVGQLATADTRYQETVIVLIPLDFLHACTVRVLCWYFL